MPLPQIDITFSTLAVSAVKRSERGILALVLRDDTNAPGVSEHTRVTDVVQEDWTGPNYDLIVKAFLGNPSKVIIARGATTDLNYNDQLNALKSKKFNWIAVPGIDELETSLIASWVDSERTSGKMVKAVLPNTAANDESVANFATEGIVVGAKTYSASEYTARIAGILAGIGLDRSATYFELAEVEDIVESVDPDADVDAGKLILIKQDGSIKIARGVTSLITTTASKSKIFKKIKIVEGMDLIKEDLKTTFNNEYVGKVNNSYDNQVLLITAMRAYLRGLEGEVLDPSYSNSIEINIEKQRLAWEGIGTDTSAWDDQKVKENSFEASVFLGGNLKFLDAMEDLTLDFVLA